MYNIKFNINFLIYKILQNHRFSILFVIKNPITIKELVLFYSCIVMITTQQGIGLVEVMVSLLLLAIAILGFTSMQMTAVKATDESMTRTKALTILRNGAEMMRVNIAGVETFKNTLNSSNYQSINLLSCTSSGEPEFCNSEQLAIREALSLKQSAEANNIQLGIDICPETETAQPRQCLIASWGKTKPVFSDEPASQPCAKKSNGHYYPQAQCFIMEAY